MFLAMTSNSAFWDASDELLFLGPWCTRYERRHEWEGVRYRMMSNPWDDRLRLDKDISYCAEVSDQLARELTSYLNESHRVSCSARYWRILLGYWLHCFVHDMYGRYVHVRAALDQFPDVRTLCLARSCFFTPSVTADYEKLCLAGDHYPLQLYSQVLRSLGRGLPERCSAEFTHELYPEEAKEQMSGLNTLVESLTIWLLDVGRRFGRQDIRLGNLACSRRHVWSLVRALRFRAAPLAKSLPKEFLAKAKGSDSRRKGLSTLRGRDQFERLLIDSLPENFPAIFLEGFHEARELSRAEWEKPPRLIVAAAGWYTDEYFKFVAAESSERGTRLVGAQHGGGYGSRKMVAGELLERSLTDRWYAWGWASLSGDPKVKDLPSPHLSGIRPVRSRNRSEEILYVSTTTIPIAMFRMHHCPMGNQVEEYFRWRLNFLAALSPSIARRVLVRPHPCDMGWKQELKLKDAMPEIRLDGGEGNFLRQMKRVRLAVFDYPGTSLLEGLVSEVP